MKISKEIRDEIRKQSVARAFLLIGALLSAVAPTVKLWASQVLLTDKQAEATRYWLVYAGATLLILSAWILFYRTFRKLKALESQISSDAPFRVSDDFEFDTDGYWIERKTGLRVCATCILPPTKIVSHLFEAIGSDFDGEPAMVWRCRKCGDDYFHKK